MVFSLASLGDTVARTLSSFFEISSIEDSLSMRGFSETSPPLTKSVMELCNCRLVIVVSKVSQLISTFSLRSVVRFCESETSCCSRLTFSDKSRRDDFWHGCSACEVVAPSSGASDCLFFCRN